MSRPEKSPRFPHWSHRLRTGPRDQSRRSKASGHREGDDRTIKLWDPITGQEIFSLRGHASGLTCVTFSPDGKSIASGSIRDRTQSRPGRQTLESNEFARVRVQFNGDRNDVVSHGVDAISPEYGGVMWMTPTLWKGRAV